MSTRTSRLSGVLAPPHPGRNASSSVFVGPDHAFLNVISGDTVHRRRLRID